LPHPSVLPSFSACESLSPPHLHSVPASLALSISPPLVPSIPSLFLSLSLLSLSHSLLEHKPYPPPRLVVRRSLANPTSQLFPLLVPSRARELYAERDEEGSTLSRAGQAVVQRDEDRTASCTAHTGTASLQGERGGRASEERVGRRSGPGVREEALGRDEALVLDVRVGVRHELHDARFGAEVVDGPAGRERARAREEEAGGGERGGQGQLLRRTTTKAEPQGRSEEEQGRTSWRCRRT